MKRYLKNLGIMLGIIVAEINVFFLGKEMLDKNYNVSFSLSTYEDIVNIIFNSDSYKFVNLQIWFIAAFALFLFIYVNVFISQILETPKYRSIKLYRYGKDKYIAHCKRYAVGGNLFGIVIVVLGIAVIGFILSLQGKIISFNGYQCITIGLQLLKLFLIMELYGSINIYYLIKTDSSHVLTFSLVFVFLQLLIESFSNKIHIFTLAGVSENVFYIIGLIVINVVADLLIRWSVKRISMC